MSLYASPDEPSVVLDIGRYLSIVVWLGSIREWRLGFENYSVNQTPHWQFYLGCVSLIRWLP